MAKMYNSTIKEGKIFVHLNFHIKITGEDTNDMTSHLMKSDEVLIEIVDEANLDVIKSKQMQVTEEEMISSSYNVEREYNDKSIQFDYMVTVTG